MYFNTSLSTHNKQLPAQLDEENCKHKNNDWFYKFATLSSKISNANIITSNTENRRHQG